MTARTTNDSLPPLPIQTLLESSRALPLVAISIALREGAAADPLGREGCARLAARLMRRTAGGLDPQQLDARIDSLGAALSVDASHSSVAFQGVVVSRSLPRFLDLVTDMLGRPGLSSEELERLRRETLGELTEVLDNDRSLALRWFRRRLFGEDPFGRSVSGTRASIAALTPADVAAFFAAQVRANNLVLALAGDLDEAQAARAAAQIAAAVPAGVTSIPTRLDDPPRRVGRHLVIVDKPDRSQTQILIGGLGTRADDPDHTALLVANTVFGGTFGARLAREIRVERGWSYGAYSSLTVDRRRHAFSLWTFPKAEDAGPCIRHQLTMLERWVADGVTATELEQAQSYLTRSHVFAIDTAAKRVGLALDEELYGLPPAYHERYPERVRAVTRDEVNAAIRRRISPEDLLVVVLGTEHAVGHALREAIPGLASVETVPYDLDP